MIRKCLVINKQSIYLQTTVPPTKTEGEVYIEVAMPLTQFWKLEEYLKETSYLQASGEPVGDVVASLHKIFNHCRKFAVHEKDRSWLSERAKK